MVDNALSLYKKSTITFECDGKQDAIDVSWFTCFLKGNFVSSMLTRLSVMGEQHL